MGRYVPRPRPHRKPGPKAGPPLVDARTGLRQGRDYYCGGCTGFGRIPCPDCFGGCPECYDVGEIQCPECLGGAVDIKAPEWLPSQTPHPPVSSRGDSGEKPVPGGERVGRLASRLTSDPIPES